MNKNKVQDYDYDLPKELIAQEPLPIRDQSRMLVLNQFTGEIQHTSFSQLAEFLNPGDLLVFNDTKVLPARFWGYKNETGGRVEFLLLRELGTNKWDVLCSPGRKVRPGDVFHFEGEDLEAVILNKNESGSRTVLFKTKGHLKEIFLRIGQMPLPPYIKQTLNEPERYQTIFAANEGSAAAPTAGLHFTPQIFERLKQNNIEITFLTLHVGLGTFRPIKTEYIEEHTMHFEYYNLGDFAADKINKVKEKSSRVVAVGTTTCRVLESASEENGRVSPGKGTTGLFICPGYRFKLIDALITNFHLPRSTLLMMICAFAGKDNVFHAYQEAIKYKYRFYSFGDCMLIL